MPTYRDTDLLSIPPTVRLLDLVNGYLKATATEDGRKPTVVEALAEFDRQRDELWDLRLDEEMAEFDPVPPKRWEIAVGKSLFDWGYSADDIRAVVGWVKRHDDLAGCPVGLLVDHAAGLEATVRYYRSSPALMAVVGPEPDYLSEGHDADEMPF